MDTGFTPFRDLWQTMAGDLGIVTKRMRASRLDESAEQEQQLRDANIALADVIRTGSPEEQAIAAQRMRDVALATSRNIASLDRTGRPQFDIPSPTAMVAPFYDQREQGRIAAETDAQNKAFEITKQHRDEFHDRLMKVQDQLITVRTNANTFLALLNENGAADPAVQSRYRDLIGMSASEAKGEPGSFTLGLHGLGHIQLGGKPDTEFGYNAMVKGASAWLKSQLDPLTQLQKQTATAAVQSGFQLDPSGGLLDVGVPRYQAPVTAPRAPNESDVPAPAPAIADSVAGGVDAMKNAILGLGAGLSGTPIKPSAAATVQNMSPLGILNVASGGSYMGPSELDEEVAKRVAALTPEQRTALELLQQQQARRRRRASGVIQRPVNP